MTTRRTLALCTLMLGAFLALAGSVPAALVGPRSPRAAAPVVAGSTYVALGDSVTFGFQELQVRPAPDYANPATFVAYPEQLGAELHLRVVNAACPGETSASLVDANAPSNSCENAPSPSAPLYRKLFPLHARYGGSQLAFAVSYLRHHSNVRLVSLMIGANDLFRCQETTPDQCGAASERQAAFTTVARNVRTILSAVRKQGHYGGQLAIVNYYSLNYTSAYITTAVRELNSTVDAAARPYRVTLADGFGKFATASLRFGSDPCQASLLTNLGSPGKCGVHPTYAGQALLAQAVEQAIRL